METYDPAKVGARIAWGRSHIVYHYGEREVIRFPSAEMIAWGSNLSARYERDISVAKKYLGDYVLDTRIVQNPARTRVVTIQPYVEGHYLSKEDLLDPIIKSHFDDLIARHEEMLSAGYQPLDLIGQGGVFRRRLSNVMVLPNKTLRLFDILIMDTYLMKHFQRFGLWLRKPVLVRQASVIRYLKSVAYEQNSAKSSD